MKSISIVALLLGIVSVVVVGLTVVGLLVAYINHKQPTPFWDVRPSRGELMSSLQGKSGLELVKECESIIDRVVRCKEGVFEAVNENRLQQERFWTLIGKWLLGILAWSCVCASGFFYIFFVAWRQTKSK